MFNNVVIFSENPASISKLFVFETESKAKEFVTALIKTFNSVNKSDFTDNEISEILNSDDKQFYLDESFIIELKETSNVKEYVINNDYNNFSDINYFEDIF